MDVRPNTAVQSNRVMFSSDKRNFRCGNIALGELTKMYGGKS